MKILLHKFNYFVFTLMFFSISGNMDAAQVTINSAVIYNAIYAGDDIIIASGGTFTINSDAQLNTITVKGSGTLIVNSPYILTVGISTNAFSNQVVDFANNSIVTINAGATLIVYGLLNNSNNSTGISFNGTVKIFGNVTGGNGSTIVGTGTLEATGTIITDNSGAIFGSDGNCSTGPCSGGSLCGFTTSISSNQTVCSNVTPSTLSSTTNASSPEYQWQSSIISGGGFADINGATSPTYSFSAPLSQTTYYRLKVKSTCTVITSQITITVNSLPVIASQPVSQLDCEGASVSFNVVASGATTYTWKYKLPGGSFATMPVTNVTYPTISKITVAKVGSAQFPDGTQFQVIVFNGTCSVSSSIATLSVNEITGITGSPLVTQCYGTNYALTASVSVTAIPNVVSYQWKKSITSGVWTVVDNVGKYSGATTASLNITGGTPSESAAYRVYITFNNSTTQCSVDSSTRERQITFLPLLTAPTITSITQPNCVTPTGTIDITVQSASDIYSFDNGGTYQSSNTKSGLAAGNYIVLIKNIAGCISSSTAVNLSSATTTWSGSWSDGVPTINQKIIFNSSYNSTGDLSSCSCYVSGGANVIINSGHTLTVANEVTVASSGSLTFEDTASLVQLNNVANADNITYKRLTTPISKFDYTYWSSPVSPQTLYNVSSNTAADKFFSFDAVADAWKQESSSTVMGKGIGYIIRGPQNFTAPLPPGPYQASFSGVPNNGNITVSIIPSVEASYLLGNPYPSALDANAFLIANSGVLDGTIYFWTHNTPITGNLYSQGDYASYNLVGGVKTSAVNTGVNVDAPSGKIGSGQAFFATSIAAGTVVFNNNMRVGVGGITGNNSQFFKFSAKSKMADSFEKNRVWLNLYNNQGVFKQALVGYVDGATNDYDNGYDGETFDGNEFLDFYSINQDKNLVIQGRSLPFNETDVVSIGYRSTIVGDFTIAIDQTDGLFVNQDVFIEDKNAKIIKNLKEGAYNFSTEAGTFNDRFVLRYTNKTLGTNNFDKLDNTVLVSNKNKQIKINSSVEMINKVQVYDLWGRSIYQKTNVNTNEFIILNLASAHQTLLVKILLQNGQTFTDKIAY
ncbi:hypothetical protein IWX84_001736 [Flavobacterium sp. CG_9.10]|uniref:T9SS sorting signal type C domain-containing protein n=1 Tax=Flavobacterium sp. CG_9.10 TaxID=2787729 RepID=UPI0018C91E0F|nr:T9SS sorting signal type C domain-containing protein [Flavobacterium sp. CG_9.10]MBG6110854.1 hypothetical protein [Flavobacterium sp. CG_9.10]